MAVPASHDGLTDRARKVLRLARETAAFWGHTYVGPEHILLGIVEERHSVAATVLKDLGVSLQQVKTALTHLLGHDPLGETKLDLSAPPPEEPPCSSTSAPSTP